MSNTLRGMAFEEYKAYYFKHLSFPDHQYSNPKKILAESEIKRKYDRYIARVNKVHVSTKYAEQIEEVMQDVKKHDKEAAKFYERIAELDNLWGSDYESEFRQKNKELYRNICDPAHIFPRSVYPALAADKENIIMLPRVVHEMLDGYREVFSPDHKMVHKERQIILWRLIIGDERYDNLLRKARKTRHKE